MDYIDEFVDGVMAACKEAGLSDKAELEVAHVISKVLADGRGKAASEDWKDKIYRHVLQIPAPVLTGGAAALASLPMTAMFGKRDRHGRKNYMRNAIISGSLGAAVPVAFPDAGPIGRFNADRRYRAALGDATARNIKVEKAFEEAGAGLQPGEPGTPAHQQFMDYHTQLGNYRNQYQLPMEDALAQSGDPGSRWKYLLKPIPKQPIVLPDGRLSPENMPPPAFPDYVTDRSNDLLKEQPVATP